MWIYGAGGFGRETHEACEAAGIQVDGFVDDALAGTCLRELPVISGDDVRTRSKASYVVAIADPTTRLQIHNRLRQSGLHPTSVIDPRAHISPRAMLGPGAVVLATAFISTDVALGEAAHVNYGVSVGHDTSAGPAFTLLPGARVGGTVSAGNGVLVGSGAVVLQGISLGDEAIVGAGAVVRDHVERAATVVGVPARPLRW